MRFLSKAVTISLVAGFLSAGPSFADPISPSDKVDVRNIVGSVFTPSPVSGDPDGLYTNLTIQVSGINQSVSAGMFVLDYREAGNSSSPWQQFLSFCLSPDVRLEPFDNPYTAHSLAESSYAATADRISEFWGRYRDSITNNATAAAFQVGLWELAFDTTATSLASGNFRLVSTGAVFDTVQNWLNSLDGTGPRASGLIVLVDKAGAPNVQDLVTQQVPEPGTLTLLGLGLAGLAFASRRRRSA